jgi:hypothetical protein
MDWTQSAEGKNTIKDFMDDAKLAFDAVWGAIQAVARAFGKLFSEGQPESQGLLDNIKEISEKFEDWITRVSEDGTLKQWFDDAKDVGADVKQLIEDIIKFFDDLDTPENRKFLGDIIDLIGGIVRGIDGITDAINRMPITGFFRTLASLFGEDPAPSGQGQDVIDQAKGLNDPFATDPLAKYDTSGLGGRGTSKGVGAEKKKVDWGNFFNIEGLRQTFADIADIVTFGLAGMTLSIGTWARSAKETFSRWGTNVTTFFSERWDRLKTTAADALLRLRSNIATGVGKARTAFEDGWRTVSTWFQEKVITPIKNAWDSLTLLADRALSNLKSLAARGMNRVIGAINRVIDGINSVLDFINAIPGPQPDISDIPNLTPVALAAGAIVKSPTFAQIGEAGAEAVIPLTRPLSMVDPSVRGMAALLRGETGGASRSVTMNVYPAASDPEAVAASVLNRLAVTV